MEIFLFLNMNFVIRLITVNVLVLFSVNYINADCSKDPSKNCCKCGSCGAKKGESSNTSGPKKGLDPTKGEKPKGPAKVVYDQNIISIFQNKGNVVIDSENIKNLNTIVQPEKNTQPVMVEKKDSPGVKKGVEVKGFNCFSNMFCPHIGLSNIGATCYMNATLQCFAHIRELVNFFKNDAQVASMVQDNKDKLTPSFKLLIDNLWPDKYNQNDLNQKQYAPNEFKAKISKMNPLFEGIAANDAKDLVNFIILTLHEELNNGTKSNNNNGRNIDATTYQSAVDKFLKYNCNKNNSIMSSLFYGINCNMISCPFNHPYYSCQYYCFIFFPLEEVRKCVKDLQVSFMHNNIMKIENDHTNILNNMQYYTSQYGQNSWCRYCSGDPRGFMASLISENNRVKDFDNQLSNLHNERVKVENEVNIYECFEYDRAVKKMDVNNRIYCKICGGMVDGYTRTTLVTGPNVLVLILNRGRGIEFNVKLNFTEDLNLGGYIETNGTGCNYKLFGVITHLGDNDNSGHFIAYCKDPFNGKWYQYNDAMVKEVNDFKKEVIDFGMPYVLFYQKVTQ